MAESVDIRKISVLWFEDSSDFSALMTEYGDECAIAGLPPITEKLCGYMAIENTGMFQAFGAYHGEKIVGFVGVITAVLPHYGVAISVAESLFVAKEYRWTGSGLKLLNVAEEHAISLGSPGILFSAPKDGTLEKILPRRGYRETNTTFFKGFT